MKPAALVQLVEKIRQARGLGLLPPEWGTLAEAALAESADHWQSEQAFRLRTGTGERWCQRNFPVHEAMGLARRGDKGQREWHLHARAARGNAAQDLIQQIRDDLNEGAA